MKAKSTVRLSNTHVYGIAFYSRRAALDLRDSKRIPEVTKNGTERDR
jgi:hypothetical protein